MRTPIFSLLLLLGFSLQAQVLTVSPGTFTADDSVTLTFHAAKGNGTLKGYTGDVYAHTGVITGTADEPSGWRYVQGNWGEDDARMRMKKVAPDTYQFGMRIRKFYGLPADEPLLQLSFVFRNQNGSLVAKDSGDADIYFPKLKVYKNGPIEQADGRDGVFAGKITRVVQVPDKQLVQLFAENGRVDLSLMGEGALKLSFLPMAKGTAPVSEAVIVPAQPGAQASVTSIPAQPADFQLDMGNDWMLKVKQNGLQVEIWKSGQRIFHTEKGFFIDAANTQVGTITGIRTELQADERIFGGGSRAVDMNRRGMRFYGYNTASYGYTWGQTALNLSIPFLISDKGYGLFYDSYRRSYFDVGHTEPNVLEFGCRDTVLDLYLLWGPPATLTHTFTRLTGRQPLPPHWALGYMQSRYGYRSQSELEGIVRSTQNAGIPLDAVLLDLQWFGDKQHMGDLDWDRKAFPQPEKMISALSQQGIHSILITESYFVENTKYYKLLEDKGWFTKDATGHTFRIADFWAGPAGLLDVFQPDAMDWFWEQYRRMGKSGNAGWWCDSGEPENHPKGMVHSKGTADQVHNIYTQYWSRGIAERFYQENPNSRLFLLNRSGYAGMQRYSVFPWSGDVSRNWDALRAQVPITLSDGLCGVGYMHSDLGGFTGGGRNNELFLRWMQLGVFSPIMRLHGDALAMDPEPIFYDEPTLNAARELIKLRYRMLPYNINLAWENTQYGKPLARPLFYEFPKDAGAWDQGLSFMWGSKLLVAPVLEEGIETMPVYLPAGTWYHLINDSKFIGGRSYEVGAQLSEFPVFVKAGTWFPLSEPLNNTGDFKGESWMIHYFPDEKPSSDTWVYEDGETRAYEKGIGVDSLTFSGGGMGGAFAMNFLAQGSLNPQGNKTIMLFVHQVRAAPKKVYWNKTALTHDEPGMISMGEQPGYLYDPNGQLLIVTIKAQDQGLLTVKGMKWVE